jgi:hypothetical protein
MHVMAFVLPPIQHNTQRKKQSTAIMFSHQCWEGNKQGGDAYGNLIGCSELNWDLGCVNCCASSFVGVDSLDETRFCFSLGHPSIKKSLLLLLPPIHLQASTNFHHILFTSQCREGNEQGGGASGNLIVCSELKWDLG